MKNFPAIVSLLRLPDQYTQVGSLLVAALYLQTQSARIVFWLLATTLLSMSAFIINEVVDRQDTDRYSWNRIHHRANIPPHIIWMLFWITSISGLVAALGAGVLPLGCVMWTIGVLYSLKPIRLKATVVLDIVAQLLVWCIVPFLGVVFIAQPAALIHPVILLISLSGFLWYAFYPYQLADFDADRKARLVTTHTRLGLEKSLWVGGCFGLAGFIIFALGMVWKGNWWVLMLPLSALYVSGWYSLWLVEPRHEVKIRLLQRYVTLGKPISQVLVLFLLGLWLAQ